MGRPKGSKNRSNGNAAPPLAEDKTGHNANGGLTDEQRQALFFQHKKHYDATLAAKKAADATFKNACKLAKSELGKDAIDEIKDAILLESDEGDGILKARIERQLRIARYMGATVGTQFDLLDSVDRVPAVDRARAAGKTARLRGEPLHPPHSPGVPQHEEWIAGWHEGEKALAEAQKRDDTVLFDTAPIGDQAETFTETAATH